MLRLPAVRYTRPMEEESFSPLADPNVLGA